MQLYHSFADVFLSNAIELGLKATLLLIVGILLVQFAGRTSAAFRHFCLAACLIAILFLPIFTLTVPRVELPLFRQQSLSMATSESLSESSNQDSRLVRALSVDVVPVSSHPTETSTTGAYSEDAISGSVEPVPTATNISAAGALLFFWLVGCLLVVFTGVIGEIQACLLRRTSREVTSTTWQASLSNLQSRTARDHYSSGPASLAVAAATNPSS